MSRRPVFDITRAWAMLEKLCAELIAHHADGVALEALKLGEAQREAFVLHGRLRNVADGVYLDLPRSRVSIQALQWLGGVGSNSASRPSWDDTFDQDLRRLRRVIVDALETPPDGWSSVEPRREARRDGELGAGTLPARASAAHEGPGNLAGLSVLVVGGEVDSLDRLGHILEASGARVYPAADAARALETLGAHTPNLMISDIRMPDEEGYSLMERVRNLPSRDKRRIPAIALGSFARASDVARAHRAGFDLHMAKPVPPPTLTRAAAQLAMPAIVLG